MDKMMNFEYFLPTRIVFGVGTVNKVGKLARNLGKKAMIVTGRSSTKKTGLLDEVISILEKSGIESVVFDDIVPNPLSSTVDKGAETGQAPHNTRAHLADFQAVPGSLALLVVRLFQDGFLGKNNLVLATVQLDDPQA